MKSIALFMSPSLILVTLFVENLNWRWTGNFILLFERVRPLKFWLWHEPNDSQYKISIWVRDLRGKNGLGHLQLLLLEDLLLKNYFCSLFCGCLTFWNYGEVGWDSKTIWQKNIGKISTPQQPKLSKYNTTVVCITLKMDNLSPRIFQSHGSSHVYSAFE